VLEADGLARRRFLGGSFKKVQLCRWNWQRTQSVPLSDISHLVFRFLHESHGRWGRFLGIELAFAFALTFDGRIWREFAPLGTLVLAVLPSMVLACSVDSWRTEVLVRIEHFQPHLPDSRRSTQYSSNFKVEAFDQDLLRII